MISMSSPDFKKSNMRHLIGEKGDLRTLLHGTHAAIDRFDTQKVGSSHNTPTDEGAMFFFTDDRKTAAWYAKSAFKRHGGEPHIISVRLHLKNPKVVDFQGTGIETLFEDIDEARTKGHDGLITLNYDDGGIIDQFIAFDAKSIEIVGCEQLPSPNTRKKLRP